MAEAVWAKIISFSWSFLESHPGLAWLATLSMMADLLLWRVSSSWFIPVAIWVKSAPSISTYHHAVHVRPINSCNASTRREETFQVSTDPEGVVQEAIRNLYSYVTSSSDIRYRSYAAIVQRKSRVRGQISAPSVPSCVCANELSFKICVFQVVKSPQSRRDRCYCYRHHVRS